MQEYEAIKGARAVLEVSQASTPSERTKAGYVARAGLIMRHVGLSADVDALIAQARQTRSASSRFSRRAALMYSFRQVIGKLLPEQNMMQRAIKASQTAGASPSR